MREVEVREGWGNCEAHTYSHCYPSSLPSLSLPLTLLLYLYGGCGGGGRGGGGGGREGGGGGAHLLGRWRGGREEGEENVRAQEQCKEREPFSEAGDKEEEEPRSWTLLPPQPGTRPTPDTPLSFTHHPLRPLDAPSCVRELTS